MSTLLEYLLPFCKDKGIAICMKGSNIEDEMKNCKKALQILNGSVESIDNFFLPFTDYSRNVILIKKIGITPKKYPRRQGKPAKEPIGRNAENKKYLLLNKNIFYFLLTYYTYFYIINISIFRK